MAAPRQRALLAILIVRANTVVSVDQLIDDLWGARSPGTAATALHGLVSHLRKLIEPGRGPGAPGSVLVTRAPGYMLRVEPEAIDARQFERLALEGRQALGDRNADRAAEVLHRALDLWRGSAFADVDAVPLAHAEANRLEELRLEALEDRIDAHLALGRDGVVVSELRSLVEREPFRERPRGQLMLALYRAGRQAEALELYQETRRTFVDQLGIEPTPRLRELQQAILAQDPELDAGLPPLRPLSVLRGRSSRVLLPITVLAIGAIAALMVSLSVRGDGQAVLGAPGSVAVVDVNTRRVVDTVEVGSGPVAIAAGHGSLWVANSEDDTVSRIDPATHEVVATMGVASPVDLAVGTDAIWVASGIDGSVARIDPRTNDVVATLSLRGDDVFAPRTVHGIAAGRSGVWAAVSGNEMAHVGPTQDDTRWFDVGADQLAAAIGHDTVWAVTSQGQLLRIEPTTGAITTSLSVGAPGDFPRDVVATDDGVLVLVAEIWLIDPDSTRLARTLPVRGVTAIADQPGPGFWASTIEGTLALLDPELEGRPPTVKVGQVPTAIAVASGMVWVTIDEPES